MKKQIIIIVIIVFFQINILNVYSNPETIGLKFNTLFIELDGIVKDYYTYNPVAIEEASNYRERALNDNLYGSSISDVDKYYKSFYNTRSYPVIFSVEANHNATKKTIYSESGGMRPWDDLTTYIVHHDGTGYTFEIGHTEQYFFLNDSTIKYKMVDCDILFDPSVSLNPYILVENIDFPIKKHDNGYYLKLPIDRVKIDNIISAEYISDKDGVIKKSLLKYKTTSNTLIDVMLIEPSYNEYNIPDYFNVTIWRQQLETSRYVGDNPVVQHEYDFSLISDKASIGFKDIYDLKRIEMSFSVTNFVTDEDVEDIFWPSIPEGYKYQDNRKRNESLIRKYVTNRDKLSESDLKPYKGIGPYNLPK